MRKWYIIRISHNNGVVRNMACWGDSREQVVTKAEAAWKEEFKPEDIAKIEIDDAHHIEE